MTQKYIISDTESKLPERSIRLAEAIFFTDLVIYDSFLYARMPVQFDVTYTLAYQVSTKKAFCNCAHQPKPCLHARAFAIFCTHTPHDLVAVSTQIPHWAEKINQPDITSLNLKQDNEAEKVAAKEQRRNDRIERAAHGLEDLENWLFDAMRRGLAATLSEDPAALQHIATRMADASLPGLSRLLRISTAGNASSGINNSLQSSPKMLMLRPDWLEKTTALLAQCYLAIRAFRRRDDLDEAMLYDLQTFMGIAIRREDVLAWQDQQDDTWVVVGQQEETVEDHNKMRKTWLWGVECSRFALLIDYDFNHQGFPPALETGCFYKGKVAYYPSAYPQRVLIPDALVTRQMGWSGLDLKGIVHVETFADCYATALAIQPWLSAFPVIFSEVKTIRQDDRFLLMDQDQSILPLQTLENTAWQMFALSAGLPVVVFGVWDGAGLTPLSVLVNDRFVIL